MGGMKKPWRGVLFPFLVASLLFTSGCGALLLLGVGGAGGYMIKKGEETEQQERSDDMKSFSPQELASLSEAGQEMVLPGGAK